LFPEFDRQIRITFKIDRQIADNVDECKYFTVNLKNKGFFPKWESFGCFGFVQAIFSEYLDIHF
jgi:hypothetical protein